MEMNRENFGHNQISLILKKNILHRTFGMAGLHTGTAGIFYLFRQLRREIFVLVNTAANISLPKFI